MAEVKSECVKENRKDSRQAPHLDRKTRRVSGGDNQLDSGVDNVLLQSELTRWRRHEGIWEVE